MIALLAAGAASLVASALLSPMFIRWASSARVFIGVSAVAGTGTGTLTGTVRPDKPVASMGGLVVITSSVLGYVVAVLFGGVRPTATARLLFFILISFGAVGAVMDTLTARTGMSTKARTWLRSGALFVLSITFALLSLNLPSGQGAPPAFFGLSLHDLSAAFGGTGAMVIGAVGLLWIWVLVGGFATAVNTVEDFDGLAAGALIMAIGAFALISFWQITKSCAHPSFHPLSTSKCYQVSDPHGTTCIAVVLVCALAGFLWWNTHPTQIRLGQTGTLALGGTLAGLGIFTQAELLLPLIGGLFLFVAATHLPPRLQHVLPLRRRWLKDPLHLSLELAGWARMTVIVRFWILGGVAAATGIGIFYTNWRLR